MKRFKASLTTGSWNDNPEQLVRDNNGDYVKYDDAIRLEIALKELLNAISGIERTSNIDNAIILANNALLSN